jgi:hypothetical protein
LTARPRRPRPVEDLVFFCAVKSPEAGRSLTASLSGVDVGAVAVASRGDPGEGGVFDRVELLERFQEKRRFCLLKGTLPFTGGAVSLLDASWWEKTGRSCDVPLVVG